jgi:hypothetical protein
MNFHRVSTQRFTYRLEIGGLSWSPEIASSARRLMGRSSKSLQNDNWPGRRSNPANHNLALDAQSKASPF